MSKHWLFKMLNQRKWVTANRHNKRCFELLESRDLLALGLGFQGLDRLGSFANPPDPTIAVGQELIVQTVNSSIALYDKTTGSFLPDGQAMPLTTFFNKIGTEYGQPGVLIDTSNSRIVDPVVSYNDAAIINGVREPRFAVGAWDRIQDEQNRWTASRFNFAISKTSNPDSLTEDDWLFFRYDTDDNFDPPDEITGELNLNGSDYPKIGFNAEGFVVSFNMAIQEADGGTPLDHVSVLAIRNDGSSAGIRRVQGTSDDFTFAPASQHDAPVSQPGIPTPMWFVQDKNGPLGSTQLENTIEVLRMNDPFASATANVVMDRFLVPVSDYAKTPTTIEPGPGPFGNIIEELLGTRFYFSGLRTTGDGVTHLVAAHSVGIRKDSSVPWNPSDPTTLAAAVRWYDIELVLGSGGTVAAVDLLQEGTINPNPQTTHSFLPAVDMREDGTIGLTYAQSGVNEYLSMYVATHRPDDPAGFMQGSILAKGSAVELSNNGARAGDYSFIGIDPEDGSFWAVNEVATAPMTFRNWGTWIQNFTPTDGVRVMNVTVSSSTAVQALHPPHHYAVNNRLGPQVGSGRQLQTVPVGGADTLSIQFSENVNPASLTSALGVIGLETGRKPTIQDVDYDDETWTATWRLSNWTANDQYLIHLSDSVIDLTGAHLDGDWTNPRQLFAAGSSSTYTHSSISEFPSGNGTPGGDFNFVITLLHGDLNLNNAVGFTTDINPALASIGMGSGMSWYNGDFTGNGSVGFTTDINPALDNLAAGKNFQFVWIAGDFDEDGDVDLVDLGMFTYPLASGAVHSDGDADGDGDVDDDDDALLSTQLQFGLILAFA